MRRRGRSRIHPDISNLSLGALAKKAEIDIDDAHHGRLVSVPFHLGADLDAEFPGGEDGFRDRLRHEVLATKLQLPAVAGFRPGILEAARDKLSGQSPPDDGGVGQMDRRPW